jgi:hypothetical protein
MMTPNHGMTGLLLALTVAEWHPELLIAAFVGGVFPDLDAKLAHRKTLHYPAHYGLLTGMFLLPAIAVGVSPLVVGTYFFGAVALHCYSDYFVATRKSSDEPDGDSVLFSTP